MGNQQHKGVENENNLSTRIGTEENASNIGHRAKAAQGDETMTKVNNNTHHSLGAEALMRQLELELDVITGYSSLRSCFWMLLSAVPSPFPPSVVFSDVVERSSLGLRT